LARIITLLISNHLSNQQFKTSVLKLLDGSMSVEDLLMTAQASSQLDISEIISSVLATEEKAVAQWKAGDQKVFGFLVGKVMAKSSGLADPKVVNTKLQEHLKGLK